MGYIKKMGAALAMLLCAGVLMLMPAENALAKEDGTVTASSANVRSKADADSTAVASVMKGDKVTILETVTGSDGKTWYKIEVDADSTGYVRADLISKKGESEGNNNNNNDNNNDNNKVNTNVTVNTEGVEEVQPISASVNKDGVRVRADASTDSSIVTTVKKDVVLTVNGIKEVSASEIWYLTSFTVDGTAVQGYIRSDFIKLNGELQPKEEEPVVVPEEPVTEPEKEPEPDAPYAVLDEEGVWYLADYQNNNKYSIQKLIVGAEQNADALEKAQKKISKQTGAIATLAIFFVIAALVITFLIFRLRDIMEEDGMDIRELLTGRREARRPASRSNGARPAGSRPVNRNGQRPAGARPANPNGQRPAGTRPANPNGQRPAGARPANPNGQRPAGSRPVNPNGQRPAGSHPVNPNGQRPAGARPANPNGQRPVGARPVNPNGQRPAGAQPVSQGQRPVERPVARPETASGEQLERQARADVENRTLEQKSADSQKWKSKNFMTDDDEFEFEFLNWDGEEE